MLAALWLCAATMPCKAHAKKVNPALANMFGGCAGLYLQAELVSQCQGSHCNLTLCRGRWLSRPQEEDVEGPKSRGKKKVQSQRVNHSTAPWRRIICSIFQRRFWQRCGNSSELHSLVVCCVGIFPTTRLNTSQCFRFVFSSFFIQCPIFESLSAT